MDTEEGVATPLKQYGKAGLLYGGMVVGGSLDLYATSSSTAVWEPLTRYGIDKGAHAWAYLGVTGLSDEAVDHIEDSSVGRYLKQALDTTGRPRTRWYAAASASCIAAGTAVTEGVVPPPEMLDPLLAPFIDGTADPYDAASNFVPLLKYTDTGEKIGELYPRIRDGMTAEEGVSGDD